MLRRRLIGQDPVALGRQLALELLDDCGGRSLEDWSGRGANGAVSPGGR
jgi:hypothetical protein